MVAESRVLSACRLVGTRVPSGRTASRVALRVTQSSSICAPSLLRSNSLRFNSPSPSFPLQARSISIASRLRTPILRKAATDAPMDPQRQRNLFIELQSADAISSHEEVVGRYEELTGLWTGAAAPGGSAVIRDDELARLYMVSLASLAGTTGVEAAPYFLKITEAPLKRAALLSSTTSTTPSSDPASPSSVTAPIANASPLPAAAAPVLSPSALITALFSGPAGRGRGGEAKILSTGSYSALPGTAGVGLGTGASEPIRVIVEEAKSPLLYRSAKFIVLTLIYSFLLLSFLSLLLDSSGILRATQQTTPFTPTVPTDASDPSGRGTTFADVHGVEEAKLELYEIVEFLKDPTRFAKLGGKLPRGVLLTGPPGTGKTLLARAVAGEAGVAFFSASGSEFDEMYVGVGAKRVRELFAAARKAAPSIIFIDELDAIGGKRSPRDQSYVKQTLNQLLVELDGFDAEGKNPVILIGATNFPESLDKALIRPGRFDRHIVVPLPDVQGRLAIIKFHMKHLLVDSQSVDAAILARGTIGFSGADLQALCNQAAVKASADNAEAIRGSHFEWAKERIMMGAARKSAFITEKDKLATAYHEGGHALVALFTKGAYPLQSVTVVPRGQALGYTLMLPEMDKNSHSFSEYRAKLDVAMGGRVAEEQIYGRDNVTDGASSDISSATSMASNMVRRFGFSDLIGPVSHSNDSDTTTSPATQAAIESEIRGLIEAAQDRARTLLKEKSVELERLARALVEHETLNLAEVKKVIAGEKIVKSPLDV